MRAALVRLLLRLQGNILSYYDEMRDLEFAPRKRIEAVQKKRLQATLLHAQQIPYYRGLLRESGVWQQGKLNAKNWAKLPILTKDIIRNQQLLHPEAKGWHWNTSGGSTGIPVRFAQDKEYFEEEVAATWFYLWWAARKDIGEKELHLWGSERDILKGSIGMKAKLKNLLLNRVLLNSFLMSEQTMQDYAKRWDDFSPKVVWSYVNSIYEFARFLERKKITVAAPEAIVTTAGVLTEEVREHVARVLKTRVHNQYGSREVGAIGIECEHGTGPHLFEFRNIVEIVDENGKVLPPGKHGRIIVTNLTNKAMPLLRYDTGDTGVLDIKKCNCGRNYHRLSKVTGRVTNHFVTKEGALVHGEYFTHLFYFKEWVAKFQVVQEAVDKVVCKVVLRGKKDEKEIAEMEHQIRAVMGTCVIEWEFLKQIPPSASGKHLYTVSALTAS